MRILFINKSSMKHEGGAETRTLEVGRKLVAMGHEVVAVSAKTNIKDPPFETLDGMKLYHKKILPDWLVKKFPDQHYFLLAAASGLLMFYLYFLFRKERFDLIREDVSPFPPSFLLSLFRLTRGKRIAIIHNLTGTLKGWYKFYGPIYGLVGYIMDRLLRSGRLKYDRIICAGKWFADALKQHPKISDKVDYVPNGVNFKAYTNFERTSGQGVVRCLSVGRLVETKGHRYLIEAVSFIKEEFPQVRVDIIGTGPLKSSLEELSHQYGVDDRVSFLHSVSHEEMPRVYSRYDFLVLPSLFEGFPVTLIEAMASQLPIVATDIPATTCVLDDTTATIANAENAKDLAEKLKWVFSHPSEVAQKTKTAFEMSKEYDWERVARLEIA